MSSETLRRAARLMRERANAAWPSPWDHTGILGEEYDDIVDAPGTAGIVAQTDTSAENAAHIAAWHPDVALAVADWLTGEYVGWVGDFEECHDRHVNYWRASNNAVDISAETVAHFAEFATEYADGRHRAALNVARVYLGESE